MGIELSAPDICDSELEFSAIEKDGRNFILFGLGAIKGVGEAAVYSILETRKEGGAFKSLEEFVNRIEPSKVNKKVIESIIKAGGFDRFGFSRKALLEQIEVIVECAKDASNAKKNALGSLFGDDAEVTNVAINLQNSNEYDLKEILEFEKETLGFYVSGHPLDKYREKLSELEYTLSSELESIKDGSYAIFIGKVEEITKKISKKGNQFGIVNLMDFHGNIEFTLFSDKIDELETMNLEEPIAFKVRVTKTDVFTRTTVQKIMTLKEAKKETQKTKKEVVAEEKPLPCVSLAIRLNDDMRVLEDLYKTIRQNPGNRELKLTIISKLQNVVIDSAIRVDGKLIAALEGNEFVDIMDS
jgi:DNA polymerase-3 subunit alpha